MEDLGSIHRRFEMEVRWLTVFYGISYDDAVKLASGRWRELSPEVREKIKKADEEGNKEVTVMVTPEEAEQLAALEGEEW
jgi:TRAP-type C4-dicarboxylate transport system substrate-binding protein